MSRLEGQINRQIWVCLELREDFFYNMAIPTENK